MAKMHRVPEVEVIANLSERERAVFLLIGKGLTSPEIAKVLGIARTTVDTYRERLKTKLKLPHGTALTHVAAIWCYLHSEGNS